VSTTPEVGKTYIVKHSRKGTWRARVLVVGSPWIEVEVLDPGWAGGKLLVRDSLVTFEEIEPDVNVRVTGGAIPPEAWGRDHFSTLLYVETCVVDRQGRCEGVRMRHSSRRPGMIGWGSGAPICVRSDERPTRLRDGSTVHLHDDWDCVSDMEYAGLIVRHGTGIQPVLSLSSYGWAVAHALRIHRAHGGGLDTFDVPSRPHSSLDVEVATKHLNAACFVHHREAGHFLACGITGAALEAEPTIQSLEAWIDLLAQMAGVPNPVFKPAASVPS
jgi:hypothetical protein